MDNLDVKKITKTFLLVYLFVNAGVSAFANEAGSEHSNIHGSYASSSWKVTMNAPEKKDDKYPDKRKITPETIRVTLDEYYVPQVSELLSKGVDCFEWVNQIDDPYLNRYRLDLSVDPEDDRVNLFWKRDF